MKKTGLLISFIVFYLIIGTTMAFAQSDPGSQLTGKVIFKLGPGEKIVEGENCFLLNLNSEKAAMVTMVGTGKSKQFYNYYADGRKEGPFRRPDSTIWLSYGKGDETTGEYKYISAEPAETYLKMDPDGSFVSFRGQPYGPYLMINHFVVAPDKNNFYASGMAGDKNSYFFDGTGRKIQVLGMVEEILMSPDGKRAILRTSGNFNLYNEEELAKMMEYPEELSNPQKYYYEITGERKGPFDPSSFRDIWFNMNNHLVCTLGNDVIVDEKPLFTTQNYFGHDDLYISDKGDKYVYYNYENIYFSDGFDAPFPLFVNVSQEGDQMIVKWVTLEDGTNLVNYQYTF